MFSLHSWFYFNTIIGFVTQSHSSENIKEFNTGIILHLQNLFVSKRLFYYFWSDTFSHSFKLTSFSLLQQFSRFCDRKRMFYPGLDIDRSRSLRTRGGNSLLESKDWTVMKESDSISLKVSECQVARFRFVTMYTLPLEWIWVPKHLINYFICLFGNC